MNIKKEQGQDFFHFIKQDNILLHSLINFQELFEDIFKAINPGSLCEIGVETGLFSQFLLEYCMENNISYFGVDIDPNAFKEHQQFSFAETNLMSSLFYLKRASTQCSDVYIIDGDHNYYTVYNELKSIYCLSQRTGKPFPFIFLHDTSWPCDKRDQYYSPKLLPKKKVLPYTSPHEGVTIHSSESIDGGFRGEGNFSFARWRGGVKNGVKTAINDFINEITDIALKEVSIPSIFGLTALFYPDRYDKGVLHKIEESLFPWKKLTPFLGRMEYNRLELYLKVIELQDELVTQSQNERKNVNSISRSLEQNLMAIMEQNQEILTQIEISKDKMAKLILRSTMAQSKHNETFLEYKNIFQGREVVILGCGSTLNSYMPIKGAIHIGCNKAFLFDKVYLDFCFAADKRGLGDHSNEFLAYRGSDCIKFIGEELSDRNSIIPHSYTLGTETVKPYKINDGIGFQSEVIPLDIDCQPLWAGRSSVHHAMQFAFYTNPSRVYLVGMDCNEEFYSTERSFANINQKEVQLWIKSLISGWELLKEFGKTYYPETEILSVNPVGLAGVFTEQHTKRG